MQHSEYLSKGDETTLKRIPFEITGLSFILSIVLFLLFDIITGLLALGGGLLSAAGFIWLRQSITQFLSFGRKRAIRYVVLFYILRVLLILGIFFIIILFFSQKVLAFAGGFSTMIPVFLVEAIRAYITSKDGRIRT